MDRTDKTDKSVNDKFNFREVLVSEADEINRIEQICFPPHEACSETQMKERVKAVPELFLVAVEKTTGKIAGFLNGLATDEEVFRDAFFEDAGLNKPDGRNVMLLGLDVLPEYRNQGLAKEIMCQYIKRETDRGRRMLVLTCLEEKVGMYERMGYCDKGISNSSWGGEEWHEMCYLIS